MAPYGKERKYFGLDYRNTESDWLYWGAYHRRFGLRWDSCLRLFLGLSFSKGFQHFVWLYAGRIYPLKAPYPGGKRTVIFRQKGYWCGFKIWLWKPWKLWTCIHKISWYCSLKSQILQPKSKIIFQADRKIIFGRWINYGLQNWNCLLYTSSW